MKLRARREEDKSERTAAILRAAAEIWSKSSWSDFTMTEVARRAGLVKGTLYLYFPTKEHLLQEVFERMIDDYLGAVDRALVKRRGRLTAVHVAAACSDNLRGRDSLLRLLRVFGLSERARERLRSTAMVIEERMPVRRRGESLRFMLRAIALFAGLSTLNDLRDAADAVALLASGMEKRR
ncbi:MAG TPA: helix-turn-helix domain-containing protein [Thermoanaerobaculia bacterium]|nr:helix-turn-helix domain-containing protein [Thermoanaerobaculia bacterium]